MKNHLLKVCTFVGGVLACSAFLAAAEFDPELASTQTVNPSGVGVAAKAYFGPAFVSGIDNVDDGKLGFLYGVEPSFQLNTGSRKRLEGSLFLGQGAFSFGTTDTTDETDVKLTLLVLPRLAMGYSLGKQVFGMPTIGVGFASTDAETGSTTKVKLDTNMSWVLNLAYDVLIHMNENLSFVTGVHYFYAPVDMKVTTANLSMVGANAGVRFTF